MDFPVLYGNVSRGDKIKQWKIWVEYDEAEKNAYIKREYGQVDGKMANSVKEVSSGKNKGRSNETSVLEQAVLEAKSIYKKQKEGGYVEDVSKLKQEELSLPMLAHDYKKRGKDIKTENAYTQPKLDGVRMMVNKDMKMISRTGKEIKIMKHLESELNEVFQEFGGNVVLDGEMFSFELTFEEISGLFRQTKNINEKDLQKMKFYVFDMYDLEDKEMKFSDRYEKMKSVFKKLKLDNIKLVVSSKFKGDIEEKHAEYIEAGYEGLMIRNGDGEYKCNYRSKDLQKYKEFQDEEYEIVDVKEALGNDAGTGVFVCKYKGEEFSVRCRGSRELRGEQLRKKDEYVGKKLTVRFQNLTENGFPRFPVGISVRDYE